MLILKQSLLGSRISVTSAENACPRDDSLFTVKSRGLTSVYFMYLIQIMLDLQYFVFQLTCHVNASHVPFRGLYMHLYSISTATFISQTCNLIKRVLCQFNNIYITQNVSWHKLPSLILYCLCLISLVPLFCPQSISG